MKFFSTLSLALVTSVIAVPLQARGIKVGALDTILSQASTTMAQDQVIINQAIYSARSSAADEIRLVAQIVTGLGDAATSLSSSGEQIAASLKDAGASLAAPNIAYLMKVLMQANTIASSAIKTFQAQGAAAAAAFSASSYATIAAEIKAAESALQPFVDPLVSYAQTAQSDGSVQATAAMEGLKSSIAASVALVQSVNDVLGVSTD